MNMHRDMKCVNKKRGDLSIPSKRVSHSMMINAGFAFIV